MRYTARWALCETERLSHSAVHIVFDHTGLAQGTLVSEPRVPYAKAVVQTAQYASHQVLHTARQGYICHSLATYERGKLAFHLGQADVIIGVSVAFLSTSTLLVGLRLPLAAAW